MLFTTLIVPLFCIKPYLSQIVELPKTESTKCNLAGKFTK